MSKTKMSPMDMLNAVRDKAKLSDSDFSKSIAIKLKPGKIKFQLIAADCEHLFRPRTQHMIPTIPDEVDPNEKWLVADCKGEGCPVCIAANAFKKSGVTTVEEVNRIYNVKFPYKNLHALFTQPEHYLLCARVLVDQADDGSYLPKNAEIGSTHLIQFPRTALNNLMSAYEDYLEDNDEDDAAPLFAIFDDETTATSLQVTCRVTNQPYSCTFAFNKPVSVDIKDVDTEKLDLLKEGKEVPEEHYDKCVKRINEIRNYFAGNENVSDSKSDKDSFDKITDDLPFFDNDDDDDNEKKAAKTKNEDNDDDFNIDDMLL